MMGVGGVRDGGGGGRSEEAGGDRAKDRADDHERYIPVRSAVV